MSFQIVYNTDIKIILKVKREIEEDDKINSHEEQMQNLTSLKYNSKGDHKSRI